MGRLVSNTRICIFTFLVVGLVVSGSGLAAVLGGPSPVASASGTDGLAAVEAVAAQDGGTDSSNESITETEPRTADEPINETDIDPRFENVTVPVEDAQPFQFGTTVFVREETVLSMTFNADPAEIPGSVSVSESRSPALDELPANRTLHRAVDITVPETATETAATLQLVVRALPVQNRENLEVMRYNETAETWESLPTASASNRTWSTDRGASVLLIKAETPGFSTFAVTETDSTDSDPTAETDSEPVNETDSDGVSAANFKPHPDATTVWINDRRPYEYGTTVEIYEETVRAITFAADKETIRGYVAVNKSTSPAVDQLRDERPVVQAVNITATENASRTPATLHLTVRALPFEDRNDIEVMRYNEVDERWEALETAVVSERTWSERHQASVFHVNAETPGFSAFAVTDASGATAEDDSEADSDAAESADGTSTDTDERNESDDGGVLFGFGLFEMGILVLVVAVGSGAVLVVRRR